MFYLQAHHWHANWGYLLTLSICQPALNSVPDRIQGRVPAYSFMPNTKRVTLVRLTPMSYSTNVMTNEDETIATYLRKVLISHCTT